MYWMKQEKKFECGDIVITTADWFNKYTPGEEDFKEKRRPVLVLGEIDNKICYIPLTTKNGKLLETKNLNRKWVDTDIISPEVNIKKDDFYPNDKFRGSVLSACKIYLKNKSEISIQDKVAFMCDAKQRKIFEKVADIISYQFAFTTNEFYYKAVQKLLKDKLKEYNIPIKKIDFDDLSDNEWQKMYSGRCFKRNEKKYFNKNYPDMETYRKNILKNITKMEENENEIYYGD